MQPPAIWVVLGIAAVAAIILQLFGRSLITFSLMLGVMVVVVRYGHEVLAHTAENQLTPPDAETLMAGYDLPLKQFAIIVCGIVGTNLVWMMIGAGPAFLVSLAVYFLLPASAIVLAWTESFTAALNPAMLVQLVTAMRWHYAALFGLLFLIGQGPIYIFKLFPPGLPRFMWFFLAPAVEVYFILVLFHLMGYFLLQFGYRLGIVPPDPEGAEASDEDYSLFEQFMERGQYAAALGEIQEIAARAPDDAETQRRLHRTAMLAEDHRTMAKATDRLIALHLDAGRENQAAAIAVETLAQMPDYRPQTGGAFLGLARGLRTQGKPREAVKLCNGFHKRFPDHADIPELYGLVARIFREDLGQDKQYDALCRFLKANYPDHPTTISVATFHRD
jgi:tetratricopeptide (TPR) repeat protein